MKQLLPYDIAIILFGLYPNELKTYVHTKTCTQMCIVALSPITKTWKQPSCPSLGEQIKNKKQKINKL
jgi:hypothetical protein